MRRFSAKFVLVILGVVALSGSLAAQSRDQNFPTAITSSELSGTVKARDMGDSRLTSYYYAFEGTQGDIFINVVTTNFAGDIDVFTQDGLKTLTKVVVFAESGLNETGRLIYLRKPERLILRIQGRTPNDDPASFRIKFGGSFVAIKGQKEEAAPTIESETDRSKTVVNSVGTIVELKPKPTPIAPKEAAPAKAETTSKAEQNKKEPAAKKPELVIGSTLPKESEKTTPKPANQKPAAKAETPKAREEKKADPLASFRLKIELKDGTVEERPMTEVLKFSVDRGVLTVISKSGTITRYSILDVTKVTIE